MTLPSPPLAIQANWSDTNTWNMWNQTHANYLGDCCRSVEIDRWAFRGSLRQSTCRIVANDPSCALRPTRASSPLAPNVRLGRRVRVLLHDGSAWQPHFFGYVSSYEPDPMDPNPLRATVTLESPLTVMAPLDVALPPSDHPYVYKADDPDHSALVLLMKAVNLWDTPFVNFDAVGEVTIDAIWGGATKTFAAWLGELCALAGCIISDEPLYAQNSGDPDFELRWYRPNLTDTPAWSWSAQAGELEPSPQIQWNALIEAGQTITTAPLPPTTAPPTGYRWELQRNVMVYDNVGLGAGESLLNIPPTFDGITNYSIGANYNGPVGAVDHVLDRLYFAQVITYADHVPYGLMAVEPGKASASGYISVPGGMTSAYSSPPAPWPVTMTFSFHVTSSMPGAATLGMQCVKIMGDVWAAVPLSSRLPTLNPSSPLLTPAQTGIQLLWPRRNTRVELERHALGALVGLTWDGRNSMWDGEKTWLLDGLHLRLEALPAGGHTTDAEYRFTKSPGDDDGSTGTGGPGGTFVVDVSPVDSPDWPIG